MIRGDKPWQKAIFENFLIVLSLIAITLTRIVSKILDPHFDIYNILVFSVAVVGFLLIVYAKKDQLRDRKFFNFGLVSSNGYNKKCYLIGYLLLCLGLLLTFIL